MPVTQHQPTHDIPAREPGSSSYRHGSQRQATASSHTHVLKLRQHRQPRRDSARNGVALYLQMPDVHKCQRSWGMVQHTLHVPSCAGSTDMYPAQGRTTHPTFPVPPSHCCLDINHPTPTPHTTPSPHTPQTTHHTPTHRHTVT